MLRVRAYVILSVLSVVPMAAIAKDSLLDEALNRPSLPLDTGRAFVRTTTVTSPGRQTETTTDYFRPADKPRGLPIGYGDLRHVVGANATLVDQTAQGAVYRFTTSTPPDIDIAAKDIHTMVDGDWSENPMDGQLLVAKDADGRPYVKQVDLKLAKPFSNALSRVSKIEMSYRFSPDNGRPSMLVRAFSVDVNMRALLFFKQAVRVDVTLADTRG